MMHKSLKTIACVKALRGSMAFAVGGSLVSAPPNLGALTWANHPVLAKLSSSPFFQTIINWMTSFSKEQVLAIGLLAFALGILRWIEAVGIWSNQSWAQRLAILTGAIYIPFEINELLYRFSWSMLLILTINLLIVTYLLYVLHIKRQSSI